jgi:hypothetical protein
VSEWVPGKKVVWDVTEAQLNFVKDKGEWVGTKIIFDISKEPNGKTKVHFTHVGLVPAFQCYNGCSGAWGSLIQKNLKNLIVTGKPQPDTFS